MRNLFNLTLDVVFYDTTSIYFEGKGPEGLAEKGFSRDNRPLKFSETGVKESVWKVIRDVRKVKAVTLYVKSSSLGSLSIQENKCSGTPHS